MELRLLRASDARSVLGPALGRAGTLGPALEKVHLELSQCERTSHEKENQHGTIWLDREKKASGKGATVTRVFLVI